MGADHAVVIAAFRSAEEASRARSFLIAQKIGANILRRRDNPSMRSLTIVGAIVLILGIALLFVPIRHTVWHGMSAGPVSLRVGTTERERIHPAVGSVLVICGAAMMIAGARKR